jgi:hypothetical protein
VRLAGIEPTTPWFVAKYSIQLSYSRIHGIHCKSKIITASHRRDRLYPIFLRQKTNRQHSGTYARLSSTRRLGGKLARLDAPQHAHCTYLLGVLTIFSMHPARAVSTLLEHSTSHHSGNAKQKQTSAGLPSGKVMTSSFNKPNSQVRICFSKIQSPAAKAMVC